MKTQRSMAPAFARGITLKPMLNLTALYRQIQRDELDRTQRSKLGAIIFSVDPLKAVDTNKSGNEKNALAWVVSSGARGNLSAAVHECADGIISARVATFE
jgi:hypothetical protein